MNAYSTATKHRIVKKHPLFVYCTSGAADGCKGTQYVFHAQKGTGVFNGVGKAYEALDQLSQDAGLHSFESHGWGLGGNKVMSVQYYYNATHIYCTRNGETTKAAITEEQNYELRHMSFNDYIGPAHVFAAASGETLDSHFAQFE